jgi:flagella basal body P-ring formation protein FlgA
MMLPILLSLLVPAQSCHPIHSDHIYARDLAAAEPAFGTLPPDLEIGFAPVPGLTRVIPASEIRRLAAANAITLSGSPAPACFAWPTAVPAREALLEAMQKALARRNPQIEIVDQFHAPAPPGNIVFPLSGLSAVSDAPVVWRGYIEYAPGRRFLLWARVLIRVHENHVIANEALHAGDRIRPAQLRMEAYQGPPTRDIPFASVAEAAGMVPRFEISPGAMLSDRLLEPAKEVERGDAVAVWVETAAARIEAAGVAEQSGARGTMILVRNARSGRKFHALVEDRDQVLVVPLVPVGLVGGDTKP